MAEFPGYNPLIMQLLYNRGLTEKIVIDNFLNLETAQLIHDPYLFTNMKASVEKIVEHIKAKHKIFVFGDYDADGVTAAAVLYETLLTLKANTDVYIPDRVTEGYGLTRGAIDFISQTKGRLIITVDVGIRNKEEIEYAQSRGIDVIITDHHVPPEDPSKLPPCLIIDAMMPNETYPFRFLAGVGVAAKLAEAVINRSTLKKEIKDRLIINIQDLLAIGTVADIVPLFDENRILVKRGIIALNNTNRIGLKELFKVAQLNTDRELDTWNIGFQIAPRLNAAGRMEHANTAFELLITNDKAEAETLSRHLNSSNTDRQVATEEIFAEVEEQINSNDQLLIGISPEGQTSWNEGVVGLVASRIKEKYYRPALIITRCDGICKGSGRSIEDLNIVEVLEESKEWLTKFGGHAAACGFSLPSENLDKFIEKAKKAVANKIETEKIDLQPNLKIDAEIRLSELDDDLVNNLERFAPFGKGNEKPLFCCRDIYVMDIMNMGLDGQHIKLRVKDGNSRVFTALAFGRSKDYEFLRIGDKIDMAFFAEKNIFNGKSELQMRIVDIRQTGK